jgi:hypothetical protein
MDLTAEFFPTKINIDVSQHNGDMNMGEQGKRDKGKKEKKKPAQLTLKEKRQAKKDKAATKDYTA